MSCQKFRGLYLKTFHFHNKFHSEVFVIGRRLLLAKHTSLLWYRINYGPTVLRFQDPAWGQCYKTFLSVIYEFTNFRTKLECLLDKAGKACQGLELIRKIS